jgi:hypothetical protein
MLPGARTACKSKENEKTSRHEGTHPIKRRKSLAVGNIEAQPSAYDCYLVAAIE